MSEPTKTNPAIPVQVEILGRTDFMEPEQRSLIERMPDYMENEGLKAEIRFREPGGMGASSSRSPSLSKTPLSWAG